MTVNEKIFNINFNTSNVTIQQGIKMDKGYKNVYFNTSNVTIQPG